MPPVFEVLLETIKWDPNGHLWGRGAHWPLLVSIGDQRHRSKGMQMRREEAALARWVRNSVGRCCAGGGKGSTPGATQWQRNPWARGIQALDMLRAHAILGVEVVGVEVVALAEQPQDIIILGQLAFGQTPRVNTFCMRRPSCTDH